MISHSLFYTLAFAIFVTCNLVSAADDQPVEEFVVVENEDKDSNSKAFAPFVLPPYLQQGRPSPYVVGSSNTVGDVEGLYSYNNNTLVSQAGPNGTAIASLNSSSMYAAIPYNESVSHVDGGWTENTNMAGYVVQAQEDVHAYAEGDFIEFINHGASYANGWGLSDANAETNNSNGPGGWRATEKDNQPFEQLPVPSA